MRKNEWHGQVGDIGTTRDGRESNSRVGVTRGEREGLAVQRDGGERLESEVTRADKVRDGCEMEFKRPREDPPR